MSEQRRPSLRAVVRKAVCLLVTAGAIWYVVAQIDWQDSAVIEGQRVRGRVEETAAGERLFHAEDGRSVVLPPPEQGGPRYIPGLLTLFRGLSPAWLVLALACFPVPLILMALRWQCLLRTEQLDPGFREVVRLTWLASLAANFLPGSTGTDLAKMVTICRRSPSRKIAALMTVMMCRFLGLASLLAVGAMALFSQYDRPELAGVGRYVTWGLLAMGLAGMLMLSRRVRTWFRINDVLARLPLGARLQQLDACLLHYRSHPGTLAACGVLSLLVHTTTIGCVYLLGLAVGMDVSPVHYFMLLPIIFLADSATPAINGLGVREAAFQLFFCGVGATPAEGLALCLLQRGVGLLVSLPGAITFYREGS